MKNMKLIMENWDKYLSENQPDAISVFHEVCEQKEAQRKKLLKEVGGRVRYDPDGELDVEIQPVGKWSALLGMTGILAYTGLSAFALNAGGAVGVAFFLSANVVPLAIMGALTYAYFKAKKLLQGFFKNSTAEPSEEEDLFSAASNKIQAMIEAAKEKAGLTQEQAIALLEIVNKEINEDEEHTQIAEDLLKAIDNEDSELVRALTDELDDTVTKIIQRLQDELKQHIEQTASEEELPVTNDDSWRSYDSRRMYAKT